MKNNSLREIAQKLNEAESVLLFPHINLDGDALGSCAALCKALRKNGKNAWILLEDDIPANLRFLDKHYCTYNHDLVEDPDICMCVDCGDMERFPGRAQKFKSGKETICLDHHRTTEFFCDYNYVDSIEAAAGQIVFDLLTEMGTEPDKEIAEAIFAAITTDTGNFQYSNTQKKSHLITAELYDWGADFNKVSVEIYENVRMEKMMLHNRTMDTLKILGGGLGAIVYITQDMLDETGALMDESEGIATNLRAIAGVEFSALVKESAPNSARVSLRAKRHGDVAVIAQNLGGGGHTKAAGATINAPIMDAVAAVEREILKAIEDLTNR